MEAPELGRNRVRILCGICADRAERIAARQRKRAHLKAECERIAKLLAGTTFKPQFLPGTPVFPRITGLSLGLTGFIRLGDAVRPLDHTLTLVSSINTASGRR